MTIEQPLAKPSAKKELKDWLQGEQFKRELSALLPRTMSPERFVRIAFQAVHRNPDLLKCSQESFFNCLLSLGAMGLEPDSRRAHLIPYGAECTLVVDYKGIAEVLRRNHDVTSLHCDVVYTRDEYEAEQGTNQHLRHVRARQERGTPILAYSFVRLPDGSQEFEEMTIAEIEAIRKRSRTPNKGPWVTDWDAMARKTVFRRHAKMLPLSPESRELIEREDDGDSLVEPGFYNAQVAKAAVIGASTNQEQKPKRGRPRLARNEADDTEEEPFVGGNQKQQPAESLGQSVDTPATSAGLPDEPDPLESLQKKLAQSGFAQAELINVLRSVRLIEGNVATLADIPLATLQMCLEDWENAITRMRDARAKSQQTGQQKLPV